MVLITGPDKAFLPPRLPSPVNSLVCRTQHNIPGAKSPLQDIDFFFFFLNHCHDTKFDETFHVDGSWHLPISTPFLEASIYLLDVYFFELPLNTHMNKTSQVRPRT